MMLKMNQLIRTIAGFGLMFGIDGAIALAQTTAGIATPETNMEMPHGTTSDQEFQNIEQPIATKLAVSAAGVSLIGLELWWFLGSKPKSQRARTQQGVQELEIAVDGGYEPSRVVVQTGQTVRLKFFRKDPSSCLEQVLIPDFQIARDLPLNKHTTIEFMPRQPGEYIFTCGMNMFRGVIQVVNKNDLSNDDR